jgi:phage RecT family recombinase
MSSSKQVTISDLNTRKEIYLNLLPKNVSIDKFTRTACSATVSNAALIKANCSRESILKVVNKAAQDGLMLDGQQSAIVPFGNQAVYMVMLAGLRLIVDDTKKFTIGKVAVVYKNEPFEHYVDSEKGGVILKHMPNSSSINEDDAIGAYAFIRDKETNELICEFMNKETIIRIRNKYSKNHSSKDMWTNRWTEGYRKTVYRQLTKQLPLASCIRFQSAISHDNENYTIANVTPQHKTTKEAVDDMLSKPTTKENAEAQQEESKEVQIIGLDGEVMLYPSQINMESIVDISKACHAREQEEGMLTQFFKNNKEVLPKILKEMKTAQGGNFATWAANLNSLFEII